MDKMHFENKPSTKTPLNGSNLNKMQDNIEKSCVIISPTEPTTNERVWIQKGNNLYNKNNIMVGMAINSSDGTLTSNNSYCFCGYIPVMANTTYSRSVIGTNNNVFLDKNKKYISSVEGTTFTTPDNCYYVGFNTPIAYYTDKSHETFMMNQGITLLAYEKYIESKVYVKNDNGVFEELSNKIETGIMSYNSSISSVDINNWVKHGKFVSISFRGKVGTDISNDSTLLNLPFKPAIQGTPILHSGSQYSPTNPIFSYFVNSATYLKSNAITSGQYVHVYFTYITNE